MTTDATRTSAAAYDARAAEYVDLLGAIESVHVCDKALIAEWARGVRGPIIDVGSGPGHLSEFLRTQGCDVRGIDPSNAFIESARMRFPKCDFAHGQVADLQASDGEVGGILAWYSLIHLPPREFNAALGALAAALAPGGTALLGFFYGEREEPFDHAIATAYFRRIADVTDRLGAEGLEIAETHTRIGRSHRPHCAVIAERPLCP